MAEEEEQVEGIRYLSVDDLIEINRELILSYTPGEQIGVLSYNSLESAQQRPAQYRNFAQTNDLLTLGSVLLTGIIRNHPFCNANKRTAFAGCRIFLLLNGALFEPPLEESIEVATGVAQHFYDDAQIASWISWYARPVNCAEYLATVRDIIAS